MAVLKRDFLPDDKGKTSYRSGGADIHV